MQDQSAIEPGGPSTPSPESIRQELANILASPQFATAARSRRFLSYVVEKTLAGEQESIKELILGIEVFDRGNDFDPRADTIVRVEAGKLRKRLQEYYENDGLGDAVRIEIPKGGYVPHFRVREQLPAVAAPAVVHWRWKYVGAAFLVVLVLFAITAYWLTGRQTMEPSVAVLPFLNFSSNSSDEYFADGLTEDLTDALARLGTIRVVSRTSAFAFKGKKVDIHEVGSKLHANFVVEGSVRKDGQQIKITAQLIRAGDGYHVWSNSFERDIKDVLAVQQEITRSVASVLEQKLTGARKERKAKPYTANVEAFDLYMRGRHAAAAGILGNIDEAEKLLLHSSAADPAYPLPYIALADIYLHADILELRPTRELIDKARAAVSKALALDPDIAEAHAILGSLTARHEYDWLAAEGHLRDALDLDPNSAYAHFVLAQDVLAPQWRWPEAVAETRQAMELAPLSSFIAVGQPWLQFLQRHYDPAISGFRALVAAYPLGPGPKQGLTAALLGKGEYHEAIELLNGLQRQAPLPTVLAQLAYANARAGNIAEARKLLEQLTVQSRSRFVSPASFATIYIGLNDHDRAFDYLERCRQDHESFVIFSRVVDLFDPIRSDPRFPELLAEIGLSDEAVGKNQAAAKRAHR